MKEVISLKIRHVFDCTSNGVEQYHCYLIHGVESVYDVHTMGMVDLVSFSRDGGWS